MRINTTPKYILVMYSAANADRYYPKLLINLSTNRITVIKYSNLPRVPDLVIQTYSDDTPLTTDTLRWKVERDDGNELVYYLNIWLPSYVWLNKLEIFEASLALADVEVVNVNDDCIIIQSEISEVTNLRFTLPDIIDDDTWIKIFLGLGLGLGFSYLVTESFEIFPVATLTLDQLSVLLAFLVEHDVLKIKQLFQFQPIPISMMNLMAEF